MLLLATLSVVHFWETQTVHIADGGDIVSRVIFVVTEDQLAKAYANVQCKACETGECELESEHDPKPYWDLSPGDRDVIFDGAEKAALASTLVETSTEVLDNVAWNHKPD